MNCLCKRQGSGGDIGCCETGCPAKTAVLAGLAVWLPPLLLKRERPLVLVAWDRPTERSPLEPVNRMGTLWNSDQPRSVAVVSGREEYRRSCDGRRRDNICYGCPAFSREDRFSASLCRTLLPPSFPTRCTSPTFPRCVSALSIGRFPRFPPAHAGGTVSPQNNGREGTRDEP